MKKIFENSSRLQCIFTDDGVTFCGAQQEVYYPYGSLDSIKMSLLGILQAACGMRICSFAVDNKDRAGVKEMVKFAKDAMKTAPKAEPQIFDLSKLPEQVPADLPAQEQLKQYKTLFVRGEITKEEYDMKKRQLKD